MGKHMSKVALLFAVLIAASLSTSAEAAKKKAAAKPDPVAASHQNTANLLSGPFNQASAAVAPAKPAKAAKKGKKKKS